jgi:DNA gyrase/topoisomerase IV subunit A
MCYIERRHMDTLEYQSEFKSDVTASEIVESNMLKYAKYTSLSLLPHHIDGFKLIHRRILATLGSTEDKMKGSALTGRVMEMYHPHGDNSIYNAIMRLAQPFNQVYPLIQVYGNVGDYSGEAFAAARYVDITSSEFSRDVFFNRTNSKTLTYMPSETGSGVEPAYFIPAIPTALITGSYTIGVGVKSIIPYFELQNVCDLVEKFIELRCRNPFGYMEDMTSLVKYLIPDVPSHSLLRNRRELLQKYREGKYGSSILMDGIMDIHPDSIGVRTLPYGKCLKDLAVTLSKMTKTASFVSANFHDISDISSGFEYGNIKLALKRGVNPFDILDELKRLIRFTASQSYIWNLTDSDGMILSLTPFEIVDRWYNERYRSILGDLKYTNNDLFKEYRRLMALIIVADHTDKVLEIFKKADNREATIEPLCSTFNLTENQAKYLSSLQMHQITRQGKDDLLKNLETVKGKIKDLQHKFTDIDGIIVEDARFIKEKYKDRTRRRLRYPDFMGAFNVMGGYIQFSSMEEMLELEKRWMRRDYSIVMYPKGANMLMSRIGSVINNDQMVVHPKEFKADDIYAYRAIPKGTIHLGSGTVFRTNEIFFQRNLKVQKVPVGNGFTALDRKYFIVQGNPTQVPLRRLLNAEGVKSDWIYVSEACSEQVVVVYINSGHVNELIFETVKDGDRLCYPAIGKNYIYGIYDPGDSVMLNILPEHGLRGSARYIYIPELGKFLTESRVILYLNKKTTDSKKRLVQMKKSSNIWTYR